MEIGNLRYVAAVGLWLCGSWLGALAQAVATDRCAPVTIERSVMHDRKMPDVVGCMDASVQVSFTRMESGAEIQMVPSAQPAGVIVNQDPQPNAAVVPGVDVTLFVSNGQPATKTTDAKKMPPPTDGQISAQIPKDKSGGVATKALQAPVLVLRGGTNFLSATRAGQSVSGTFVLTNVGGAAARNVRIRLSPANLVLRGPQVPCVKVPCTVAADGTVRFSVQGTVKAQGRFELSIAVSSAASRKMLGATYVGTVAGPVSSIWAVVGLVLAGLGVGLGVLVAGVRGWRAWQQAKWQRLITVAGTLDEREAKWRCGPVQLSAPAVSVTCVLASDAEFRTDAMSVLDRGVIS